MPRNVRNFWIELEVDGVQTKIATGPKSRDGGFQMVIRMREKGAISDKLVTVFGTVDHSDGALVLKAECEATDQGITLVTNRD